MKKILTCALNIELPEGAAPDWVELIPAGPLVRGRDGRSWMFGRAEGESVISRFEAKGIPHPIDWEHSTEVAAPGGGAAPAAGWINAVELRDGGALWGQVDWTPRAAEQIKNREYRFLSPVFSYSKDLRIQVLHSAGLTNIPNLHLTALNREQSEEEEMRKALCKVLGLPESATEQEVQAAVAALAEKEKPTEESTKLATPAGPEAPKAEPPKTAAESDSAGRTAVNTESLPDLTRFVPRADLDAANARALNAETELARIKALALDDEIETAVNSAIAEGKIAPASRDFYVATCRDHGGLEKFREFASSAPKVIADPKLPEQPKEGGSLSDDERAVCRNLGVSEEDYIKNTKEGK